MTAHRSQRLARLIAAGLAAGALAASPADARLLDGPQEPDRSNPGTAVAVESPQAAAPAPVVRTIDDGFDWGSAAIGAGGAGAVVVLVAFSGFAYTSHHRIRVAER